MSPPLNAPRKAPIKITAGSAIPGTRVDAPIAVAMPKAVPATTLLTGWVANPCLLSILIAHLLQTVDPMPWNAMTRPWRRPVSLLGKG
jgi:hypothetical protein